MAIVDMSRISVIGLTRDREGILEALMKMEAVHLTDIWDELKEDVKARLLLGDDREEDVAVIEEEMAEIEKVLKYLSKYDHRKKSLIEGRRCITKNEYKNVVEDLPALRTVIRSVLWCEEQIDRLHTERNKRSSRVIAMGPWEQLDIPLENRATHSAVVTLGYMPRRSDVERLEKRLAEEAPPCQLYIMNRDREHIYLCAVYHRAVAEKVSGTLKDYGFTKIDFTGIEGTAGENIKADTAKILQIDAENQRFISILEGYALEMDRIEILYDALAMKRDLKKSESLLPGTRNTFMLRGWVPSYLGNYVVNELMENWVCSIQVRKPAKEEEHPVLLKNSSIGQSVESITTLYSPPHPTETDPNPVVGIFLILFFGLMIGDAGYGAVMILISLLMLHRSVLENGMKRFMKLMLFCGISAVFWGAMFGGWFGLPFLAEYPLFLNPIENPERFLGFTLILGIVHIYVGLGMNSVKLIQKKRYMDVFLDVVLWYVFFTGFVFVVLPYAFSGSSEGIEQLVEAGKYMLAVSGVVIVLTRARESRNILKRLTSGLGSLYGIIKFLSDVLSYSRLMALGLATSVIGVIVYDIASMNGLNSLPGIAFFLIVMVLGHGLNFGIALLSAYVHSSRLQYIEFFSRFYRGGGILFKPLRSETKYINLQEVMHNEYFILGNDR